MEIRAEETEDRLSGWLDGIRDQLDDPDDLAAELTTGDIDKPDWVCIAESTDHLKIWDIEGGSAQMGFYIINY